MAHATSNDVPPTNPDVQGFAVRLSCFISHVCVAMLIAYSTVEKRRRSIYINLLSQQALIILSIWLSLRRNQLSVSDIQFAIIQTRSPVSVYALLLLIPRLFFEMSATTKASTGNDKPPGSKSDTLLERYYSSRTFDWALITRQLWGGLYGFSCLGINLLGTSDKLGYALTYQSQPGQKLDLENPISIRQSKGSLSSITAWFALGVCSLVVYECVISRHAEERREVMHELSGKRKKSMKAWPISARIRWGFVATWFIVMKFHPWLPFVYASIFFLNWSMDMRIWTIEDKFDWTYGQVLAISQAVVVVYPCLTLLFNSRNDIVHLPQRLFFDILWLVSGRGKPWLGSVLSDIDLTLQSSWSAFPPEVASTEKPVLPLVAAVSAVNSTSASDCATVSNKRSRRRRMHAKRDNPKVPVEEEDIVDSVKMSSYT